MNIESYIKRLIRKAITSVYSQESLGDLPSIKIETPKDLEHGDYAAPIGFMFASTLKEAPHQITEKINNAIHDVDHVFESISSQKGYLNFKISTQFLREKIYDLLTNVKAFRHIETDNPQDILLEFISANPTGPLNIVSARAAAVGSTLYNLLKISGNKVTSEFYVNNRGRQARLLAKSVLERYKEIHLGEQPNIPENGYQGDYVRALAKAIKDEFGPQLESDKNESDKIDLIKDWVVEYMISNQKDELANFNTQIDNWERETEIVDKGLPSEILNIFKEKDLLYEDEGATWLATSSIDSQQNDDVLVKSDDSYTYFLNDLAYHLDKANRGYDLLIDILGPDHHGHVGRMKAAFSELEVESNLEFIILQQVNLLEKGEKVKMSKRKGKFVKLQELIDEIGVDVPRFLFLDRRLESHLDFDLDLAKKESDENPVFYVQYAHARICSIKRFANNKGFTLEKNSDLLNKLESESEINLIREIYHYKDILKEVSESYQVNNLPEYLKQLAQEFHGFYHNNKVVNKDKSDLTKARLLLMESLRKVLKDGLNLMGVSAPPQM